MIDNQTIEQLRSLRLDGMLAAINDPASAIATSQLSFEQRLSLLVQREVDWRDGKRLTRRPETHTQPVRTPLVRLPDHEHTAAIPADYVRP